MAILNDVVHELNLALNKTLFSKSARFVGAKLFGISEPAPRIDGAGESEYPQIFDLNGDGTYAGIDDTQPLILYHRKQNLTISQAPGRSYGDNPPGDVNTYAMTMVVFFKRRELQMEGDELAQYIRRNLPGDVSNKNFHYLSVTVNTVVLNSQQVFRTEYSGNVKYFLKPEHALIAINYTIEGTPKMACFNGCPE